MNSIRSVALRETLFRQTGSQFGDDTFALQRRGHEITPILTDLPKPKTPFLFEPRLLIRLRVEAAETLLIDRKAGSVSRNHYVGWTITATHLFDIRSPVFDQGTGLFDHIANVLRVLVDSHGDLERSYSERQVKTTQAQRLL